MKKAEIETLIEAHEKELYRYVQFLGADSLKAEDVVQETFVAAYFHKSPPDLEDVSRRTAWLRAIAKNTFFKHCRKNKQDLKLKDEQINSIDNYWAKSTQNDLMFHRKEALNHCLKELPEKQTEALSMRYRKRMSRGDMAEEMNMSENGVKSLLQRVRQALAQCIKKRIGAES